jgi:hypothetical protein
VNKLGSIVFVVVAFAAPACKRVPRDDAGRVAPTEAPPKGQSVNATEQTCVGKALADKAAKGDARDPELGCPVALDRKKYTTNQWPPPITLAYDEDPAVDKVFTTSARQLLPMGDPSMGPACCYVTTKAQPKK